MIILSDIIVILKIYLAEKTIIKYIILVTCATDGVCLCGFFIIKIKKFIYARRHLTP